MKQILCKKNRYWLLVFVLVLSSCGRDPKKLRADGPDEPVVQSSVQNSEKRENHELYEKSEKKSKKKHEKTKKIESASFVHKAHLSSGWYPQSSGYLTHQIGSYLEQAQNSFYVEADPHAVKALIVPHAGYYYSGLCAATAYQTILETRNLFSQNIKNKHINRVIVISPSHKTFLNGIALPDYLQYQTALGNIDVDAHACKELAKSPLFHVLPEAHAQEHAIEVQLPFLQQTVEHFKLIPLIVGYLNDFEYDQVVSLLSKFIDDKTLIVVSSDFMHHGVSYDYAMFDKEILNQVRFVDSLAFEAIAQQSGDAFGKVLTETKTTICGQDAIKILLGIIKKGLLGKVEPRLSCYYTSAQMAKARQNEDIIDVSKLLTDVQDIDARNSVSYLGIIFTAQNLAQLSKENQLTGFEKKEMLKLARTVVENMFKPEKERTPEHLLWPIKSAGIQKAAGAFVTLNTRDGNLRGCIGQIASWNPLYQTIIEMSKSAAFKDNRFKPVTKQELSNLVFDITVLTAPEKVSSFQEIVLGQHGIILSKFGPDGNLVTSSVFLPQVPTSFGWDLPKTLEQLSIKAGLGAQGYKEGCQFQVFEGVEFKEDVAPSAPANLPMVKTIGS
ncbi:MAG: AmmeMemoRadiSam system protein B [bacterium]